MPYKEIEIKNLEILPEYLFHLVPKQLFCKFLDSAGNYDCRNRKEWGKNSPFIHTSPSKKVIKERVAEAIWLCYPPKEKFLLLKINTQKINSKITYSIINSQIYHHIWGSLPKNSYIFLPVKSSKDKKFL